MLKLIKKLNKDTLEQLNSYIENDIHNIEIKACNNKSYNPSMIRKNKPFDNILLEFLIVKLSTQLPREGMMHSLRVENIGRWSCKSRIHKE